MKLNKKSYISALTQMGFDLESAEEELDNLVYEIKSLNNPVKLYRIVQVESKKDINLERPGSHYSKDKKSLVDNHCYAVGYGENKFLITILADKSLIDLENTLMNNILYPNENEVTLKNGGKGVKILSVKQVCEDETKLESIIKNNIKVITEGNKRLAPYIRRRYEPEKVESLLKKAYIYTYFNTKNEKEFIKKLFEDVVRLYFIIIYGDKIEEKVTKKEIEDFKEYLIKIYTPIVLKWYRIYKKGFKI